jgi:hypothetical protein
MRPRTETAPFPGSLKRPKRWKGSGRITNAHSARAPSVKDLGGDEKVNRPSFRHCLDERGGSQEILNRYRQHVGLFGRNNNDSC